MKWSGRKGRWTGKASSREHPDIFILWKHHTSAMFNTPIEVIISISLRRRTVAQGLISLMQATVNWDSNCLLSSCPYPKNLPLITFDTSRVFTAWFYLRRAEVCWLTHVAPRKTKCPYGSTPTHLDDSHAPRHSLCLLAKSPSAKWSYEIQDIQLWVSRRSESIQPPENLICIIQSEHLLWLSLFTAVSKRIFYYLLN